MRAGRRSWYDLKGQCRPQRRETNISVKRTSMKRLVPNSLRLEWSMKRLVLSNWRLGESKLWRDILGLCKAEEAGSWH